ncbi:MAG: tetratricopeptide repeat protein [Pseudomonadota bacterium]
MPKQAINAWEQEIKQTICRLKAQYDYAEIVSYLTEILDDRHQNYILPHAALERMPREMCARLYNERGLAYLQLDASTEAENNFRAAITADPHSVNARFNLANMALYAQQFAVGVTLFHDVLKLDAHHAGALHHLGLCYAMQSKATEALSFFEQAAAITPQNMGPNFWAGETLVHLQRFAEALPYFVKSLAIMPDYQDALRGVAICQFELEDYVACVATCDALLALGQGAEFIAWQMKGDALLAMGRGEEGALCHVHMLNLDFDARYYAEMRSKQLKEQENPAAELYAKIITEHIPLLDAEFIQQYSSHAA